MRVWLVPLVTPADMVAAPAAEPVCGCSSAHLVRPARGLGAVPRPVLRVNAPCVPARRPLATPRRRPLAGIDKRTQDRCRGNAGLVGDDSPDARALAECVGQGLRPPTGDLSRGHARERGVDHDTAVFRRPRVSECVSELRRSPLFLRHSTTLASTVGSCHQAYNERESTTARRSQPTCLQTALG